MEEAKQEALSYVSTGSLEDEDIEQEEDKQEDKQEDKKKHRSSRHKGKRSSSSHHSKSPHRSSGTPMSPTVTSSGSAAVIMSPAGSTVSTRSSSRGTHKRSGRSPRRSNRESNNETLMSPSGGSISRSSRSSTTTRRSHRSPRRSGHSPRRTNTNNNGDATTANNNNNNNNNKIGVGLPTTTPLSPTSGGSLSRSTRSSEQRRDNKNKDDPLVRSTRSEKDRDAKRRARGSRGSANTEEGAAVLPGAVASGGDALSRSSRRDQQDRDAKRRARGSSRPTTTTGGGEAVLPGAVSSTGEHKSRSKTSTKRRSRSHDSLDSADSSVLSGDSAGMVDVSHRSSQRDNAKHKERRSRAVTPGAVSSSNTEDKAVRKSNRRSAHPTASNNSKTNQDEDDKVAKRRARSTKGPASVPGAMSAGPSDSSSSKEKSKLSSEDDVVVENNPAGLNADGEYAVIAEMVEEEDDDAKIQRMVQARLQAEQAAAANATNSDENGAEMDNLGSLPQEERPKQQGLAFKRICCLLICFLLVGGAVVGALFGVGVLGQNKQVMVEEETTTATPTTTSSIVPTAPPTTDMPSSSPTFFLYDKPNLDDCALIQAGLFDLKNNQTTVLVDRNYALSLEADLNVATNPELMFDTLSKQIQQNIMPKLAGCPKNEDFQIQRRRRQGQRQRQLETTTNNHDPFKYWIRNGVVILLWDDGTCEPANGSAAIFCFKVQVDVTIHVADDEPRNLYLIGRISDAFQGTLKEELGLGAPFEEIRFMAMRNLDPTEQPSPSPSMLPSMLPSMGPTGLASSTPTNPPVDYPTTPVPTVADSSAPTSKAITGEPTPVPTTPFPTKAPTKKPTPFPTAMPAPGVTPRPTITPSESPSSVPSDIPSETPSSLPSLLPSNIPSQVPSIGPSESPSSLPSESPSNLPTLHVSNLPTLHPTSSPTDTPTLPPTNYPTFTPTDSPTVAPITPSPTKRPPPTVAPFDRNLILFILRGTGIPTFYTQAINWLKNTDTYVAPSSGHWRDRYAMVTFYMKAGKSSWLKPGVTHCNWNKVNCDTNQRVVHLNLRKSGLSVIPTELIYLPKLTKLEFQNDGIAVNGRIPPAITRLSNLKNLFMRSNGVSRIGSEILGMKNLVALSLRGQRFGSPIPTHLYQMTKLTTLMLKECNLRGTIPSLIGNLSKLTTLDISVSGLTKPFPQALTKLTDLRRLVAGQNPWSSTLPRWFGKMTKLQQLYLAYSRMGGALPTEIARMTSLTMLTFYTNSFGGSIPKLPPNLRNCNMQRNRFTNTQNKGPCSL